MRRTWSAPSTFIKPGPEHQQDTSHRYSANSSPYCTSAGVRCLHLHRSAPRLLLFDDLPILRRFAERDNAVLLAGLGSRAYLESEGVAVAVDLGWGELGWPKRALRAQLLVARTPPLRRAR